MSSGSTLTRSRPLLPVGVGEAIHPNRSLVSLLMCLGALAWVLAIPHPAYAADGQIDSFMINYDMQPSGVLRCRETFTWRFGSNSGRHGMQRILVIREPDPDSGPGFRLQDQQYRRQQSQTQAWQRNSAPRQSESRECREEELNLRIGDPTRPYPQIPRHMSFPTTSLARCARSPAMTSSSGRYRLRQPSDQDLDDHHNGARWSPRRQLLCGSARKYDSLRNHEVHQGRRGHIRPDKSVTWD
jgi:hypothetical protein